MNEMVREIWRLRRTPPDPAAALDRALQFLEDGRQRRPDVRAIQECWAEHFVGSSCLLLDFARATRSEPEQQRVALDRLEQLVLQSADVLCGAQTRLLDRISLLRRVNRADLSLEQLTTTLRKAAEACWSSRLSVRREEEDTLKRTLQRENDSRPLPAFLRRLAPRDKWLDVLAGLGHELGWQNPGLLMVGQMIAHVYGVDDPTPDERDVFKTWVLLAGRNAKWPTGTLAQLRLRRLSGGCGGFFPDPAAAGYLRLKDDFKSGLYRAWNAAFGEQAVDFDVAWSLELIDADFATRSLPFSGRSAEAAICCGLRALAAGQRLDQCVAITARLDQPKDSGIGLLDVGMIDDKTLAKPLVQKKITEIVVAEVQPEIVHNHGRQVEIANGEIRLVPAVDIDGAYRRLVRWERITSHVRKQMAEGAHGLIHDLCGQYVVPSLLRPAPRQSDSPRSPEEEFKPLSRDQVEELLDGRLPERSRTLLLAHSGMGKSVLLFECLKRMAQRPDGPLPVLLDGLSRWPWYDPALVRQRMADRLKDYLPSNVKESKRWAWFRRLVKAGRMVFLLDALDQTILEKLDGMAGFLAANIGDCPVLMTGRPYVTDTRSKVIAGWKRLHLDSFDEGRQRKLLGEYADEVIFTKEERDHWAFETLPEFEPESVREKRRWADLVDQPLLLKMLRELAAAKELRDVRNRYDLYRRAVQRLIEKGWETLEESERESERTFDSRSRVQRVLQQIAWNRAEAGDFQGEVSGKELNDLMTLVARGLASGNEFKLRKALDQINVVTCGGIVESSGEVRLAWRHFSFCEYFAGLELAENYPRRRMASPPGGATCDRQPENQYAAAVRCNARKQPWHWVFRYALSQLAASDKVEDKERLAALAADLIQFGNPFVVAEAIRHDGVRLPDALDRLCRWLVLRDWQAFDAWQQNDKKPDVDTETLALLDSAFVFKRRDSRYLHAAWELVAESDLELARSIRARFLAEFPNLLASENPTAIDIRDGFREIPPVDDPLRQTMRFAVGVAEGEEKFEFEAVDRRHVSLSAPFEMARTPVTNAQFELFAPEHRHRRTDYSGSDDCPAVEVTWYEAELYCLWLGDFGGGGPCRLPTEIEWEIAARAGSEGPYCRIRESDGTLRDLTTEDDLRRVAHFGSQDGTLPVAGRMENAWGLHDMLGNVWEWCADWYAEGSLRVGRGGGWSLWPMRCRSAFRRGFSPEYRDFNLGFRPARSPVG